MAMPGDLAKRLEWFQDLKLGFFMHWGAYSQWGCIESWPLVPADRYKSPRELIHLLVDIVSKGGNLLLNVGPSPEGELPAKAVERMKAILDTPPCKHALAMEFTLAK